MNPPAAQHEFPLTIASLLDDRRHVPGLIGLIVHRPLAGLFVDDEFLAVGVLSGVALAAFSIFVAPEFPLAAGAVLLLAMLGVLVLGALRTGGRS